jgi:hypothetical protein
MMYCATITRLPQAASLWTSISLFRFSIESSNSTFLSLNTICFPNFKQPQDSKKCRLNLLDRQWQLTKEPGTDAQGKRYIYKTKRDNKERRGEDNCIKTWTEGTKFCGKEITLLVTIFLWWWNWSLKINCLYLNIISTIKCIVSNLELCSIVRSLYK